MRHREGAPAKEQRDDGDVVLQGGDRNSARHYTMVTLVLVVRREREEKWMHSHRLPLTGGKAAVWQREAGGSDTAIPWRKCTAWGPGGGITECLGAKDDDDGKELHDNRWLGGTRSGEQTNP